MARSSAKTVAAYLKELPAERRAVIAGMLKLLRRHVPKGYREALTWGSICYEIPLERFPNTYNGQPLMYLALAAQKNYCVLHLMCVYMNPVKQKFLRDAFKKAGKKLDMGKACIRFKSLDDLPLKAIAKVIASVKPEGYMAYYEKSRMARQK
ncbi:MAG: DUF1801 domain-containing protein [Planctomycetes bacterium]|nr:DUF1801 domain-containing protein [Planctomycetota bacterium]